MRQAPQINSGINSSCEVVTFQRWNTAHELIGCAAGVWFSSSWEPTLLRLWLPHSTAKYRQLRALSLKEIMNSLGP